MLVLVVEHTNSMLGNLGHLDALEHAGIRMMHRQVDYIMNAGSCDAAVLFGLTENFEVGLDIIRKMKRVLGNKPIIVISGHRDQKIMDMAHEAGARCFLTKLQNPETLVSLLGEIESRKEKTTQT